MIWGITYILLLAIATVLLADWPQRPAPDATDDTGESKIPNPKSPCENPRFRLNLFVCGHLVRYAMRYRTDDGQVYVWKFGPTDFHTLHTELLALKVDPESEFGQQDLDRVEDGMRLGLNAILKQHGALP